MNNTDWIATAGFLTSFVAGIIAGGAIGGALSVFVRINYHEVPHAYWPITWSMAGLIGIVAGIHSYRATALLYRNSDKSRSS